MKSKTENSLNTLAEKPSTTPICLWAGFESTPGIQWVGKPFRYEMWRQTHRWLLQRDARYALQNDRFHIQVAATWVFALLMFFAFTGTASVLESWMLAATGAVSLGWFVFKAEQERRNQAIGAALQEQLG